VDEAAAVECGFQELEFVVRFASAAAIFVSEVAYRVVNISNARKVASK
jgi:hypothetical protein